MEFTKEEFLNIRYNKYADVIEVEKDRKRNKIFSWIKKNKTITGLCAFFVFCVCINLVLIYQFFSILFLF